jgi:hypothetical protein
MLYREIIAVCSQIHTKCINTLREQNANLPGVLYEEKGNSPSVALSVGDPVGLLAAKAIVGFS